MAAQLFPVSILANQLTLTVGHSNYTGANATAGQVGAASPGSLHEQIIVSSKGSSVQNALHVYIKIGATLTWWFDVLIPKRTVTPGETTPFSQAVATNLRLKDATMSLAFDREVNDTGIYVAEQGVNYA